MVVRAEVNPELIAWARERSGVEVPDLSRRFPKLAEWEQGERSPTLKQLEDLARATHTPVGFWAGRVPPSEPDVTSIGLNLGRMLAAHGG